jgi:hypothetical protein
METSEYDDDYPTCVETYSTLCVFSDSVAPAAITTELGIPPTETFKKGESHSKGRLQRKANGWFYSTEGLLQSKDTRRHIDSKERAIETLRQKGCKMDISSYWVSIGQGGPALWPCQMIKLGNFGIEIWWDIYFRSNKENTAK